MRKLTLINENGQTYPLHGNVLINGIEGLGIKRENEYLFFDDRYKLGRISHGIAEISLGLVFQTGYAGYRAFVAFISPAKELTLQYETLDEYVCKVAFSSITKGEIYFGALQTNLVIHRLTPWLRTISKTIDVSVSGEFKSYPFAFPFIYGANANGMIEVTNSGSRNAYMRIRIIGEVDTPQLVVKKNEEVIGTLRLFVNGEQDIEVSSISEDEYILVGGNDAYQTQDFTCKNFLSVPPGDSTIEFYPGVPSLSVCHLVIEESYEGV